MPVGDFENKEKLLNAYQSKLLKSIEKRSMAELGKGAREKTRSPPRRNHREETIHDRYNAFTRSKGISQPRGDNLEENSTPQAKRLTNEDSQDQALHESKYF